LVEEWIGQSAVFSAFCGGENVLCFCPDDNSRGVCQQQQDKSLVMECAGNGRNRVGAATGHNIFVVNKLLLMNTGDFHMLQAARPLVSQVLSNMINEYCWNPGLLYYCLLFGWWFMYVKDRQQVITSTVSSYLIWITTNALPRQQ